MPMSMGELISTADDTAAATLEVAPGSDLDAELVSRQALDLIAQGITELVGFELAAISVVRRSSDADPELEVVADAGAEHLKTESVLGRRSPLSSLLTELKNAEDWGRFKFVGHESYDPDEDDYGWTAPAIETVEGPDAWHPLDLLLAPLYDDDGTLQGTLAIDAPTDGRRPGQEQRRMLDKYAVLAGRAIVAMIERERLVEQQRLAEIARSVMRSAGAEQGLEDVLAASQEALVAAFRAQGAWVSTFDHDTRGVILAANGEQVTIPEEFGPVSERIARAYWSEQRGGVISLGSRPDHVNADEFELIVAYLESIGIGSMLFVPIGAGTEPLGSLTLTRGRRLPPWTDIEMEAALSIGHDLGRVVLNARTYARERELVSELRALDTYKSRLISTVSHELKNPLASVLGFLEIMASTPDVGEKGQSLVTSMGRASQRMLRVVEDLLLFSRVGDPEQAPANERVGVDELVTEELELLAVTADSKSITLETDLPESPVYVLGDADNLGRVIGNLLSNAVKYTAEGGRVRLVCRRQQDHAEIAVSDTGLGISEQDQRNLFTEFFRSTNPEALSAPGTGLGLAIVKRIVERHGGTIQVESSLGRGSTFTVRLPLAGF
jgi:signal transduction histidine kinase